MRGTAKMMTSSGECVHVTAQPCARHVCGTHLTAQVVLGYCERIVNCSAKETGALCDRQRQSASGGHHQSHLHHLQTFHLHTPSQHVRTLTLTVCTNVHDIFTPGCPWPKHASIYCYYLNTHRGICSEKCWW